MRQALACEWRDDVRARELVCPLVTAAASLENLPWDNLLGYRAEGTDHVRTVDIACGLLGTTYKGTCITEIWIRMADVVAHGRRRFFGDKEGWLNLDWGRCWGTWKACGVINLCTSLIGTTADRGTE